MTDASLGYILFELFHVPILDLKPHYAYEQRQGCFLYVNISLFDAPFACQYVEIESVSVKCLRGRDKKENGISGCLCEVQRQTDTSIRIYTVDYEIKGDRGKMFGKTIEVENVP